MFIKNNKLYYHIMININVCIILFKNNVKLTLNSLLYSIYIFIYYNI